MLVLKCDDLVAKLEEQFDQEILALRKRSVRSPSSATRAAPSSCWAGADGPADQDGIAESWAMRKLKTLWQNGALFHVSSRYPRKHKAPRVDRLAGILRSGLVAPAKCQDRSVCSDLNLVVTGCSVPYDSLVFLHRFGAQSYIYTICDPGRFAVFIDPCIPVLTQEEMGPNWPVLCQDEVYVRDRIALEKLIGVAVHPADADSIMSELLSEFQHLQIPLHDYDGNVIWAPG